jgi:hypothetical protein
MDVIMWVCQRQGIAVVECIPQQQPLDETENFCLVPGPSRIRAVGSFETSQITHAMMLRHIPEDWNPQLQGNKTSIRNAV